MDYQPMTPQQAYAGPCDGMFFTTPYGMIVIVTLDIGKGFETKDVHGLLGKEIVPKRYREGALYIGYYSRCIELFSRKEYYVWHPKCTMTDAQKKDHEYEQRTKKKLGFDWKTAMERLKKNQQDKKDKQKPGWMLNSDDIDGDCYGNDDPADDWKR